MRGSTATVTLECWRGAGEDEQPVEVLVRLHVVPVHPSDGRGYEVDVVEATAEGRDFELTDAEVDRAVERMTGGSDE